MSLFGFSPNNMVSFANKAVLGALSLVMKGMQARAQSGDDYQPQQPDEQSGGDGLAYFFGFCGLIAVVVGIERCWDRRRQRQAAAGDNYQQLQADAPAVAPQQAPAP